MGKRYSSKGVSKSWRLRNFDKGRKIIFPNDKTQFLRIIQNRLISSGRRKLKINNVEKIKNKVKIRRLINDLDKQGPAGLLHLNFISKVIKRSIRIYKQKDKLELLIKYKGSKESPIDVEYHESGHWTKKNNQNPHCELFGLNDCLFEAIGSQINRTPMELRHLTIKQMMMNEKEIGNLIADIEILEENDPSGLMMGGAMYNGRSAKDAKKVLDKSQNGTCYPRNIKGHPRGHASDPSAKGETDSVENYSRTGRKTAFLSKSDQDFAAHLVLDSDHAQEAMEDLNDGSVQEVLEINNRELDHDDLPLAVEYEEGKRIGKPKPFQKLKGIIKHHTDQFKNPNAYVFVHTFYPII